MGRGVRWWLCGAGLATAVGVVAAAVPGIAGAAPARHASPGIFSLASVGTQLSAARWPVPAAPYRPPGHNLYYGNRGPAVKSVQRRLTALHYYAGPIDGVYGPDLQQAVWAFKEVQGLPFNTTSSAAIAGIRNSIVTAAFRHDLINPRLPYVLIKHGPANRVEVNQRKQVLVLYKYGKVRWILHVSSGGGYYFCNKGSCSYAITPDGNFKAYSFSPGWHKSPLCPSAIGCMWNSVWVDPAAGVAIHGDPAVPWYPASHGCIRIWMAAANWFYKDLSIGGRHPTPVYVRNKAPYLP